MTWKPDQSSMHSFENCNSIWFVFEPYFVYLSLLEHIAMNFKIEAKVVVNYFFPPIFMSKIIDTEIHLKFQL